ncbi:amidohydrolase family protein, partial [Candidatus Bathyarchaeota archaeon]|nr:amidohydrolase family protein [Candidatus Bathyarchaeota archaeon]
MVKPARFVVDTHSHITTLYKVQEKGVELGITRLVEPYDNSALCLYDMKAYDVDMCILLPSWPGTTNEMQAMLVNKYPDKFRACCSDQTLKLKCARGEAKWTLEAAVEEVEAALKTGKFVGIGEFVPRQRYPKHIYSLRERLDEFRKFMDLAAKYDVVIDYHEWTDLIIGWALLNSLSAEYPDVWIVLMHGGLSGMGGSYGPDIIRRACAAAGGRAGNIFLETGSWPAEYFEIAIKDPNVGPQRLLWGGDYGNCPQYISHQKPESKHIASSYAGHRLGWPRVPSYQTDWWGWSLHQIHEIRGYVPQDEINLILGGNAAKIFKLPVPHPRMFPEGRPDLWGIHWKDSVPFIPSEQIQNPDT